MADYKKMYFTLFNKITDVIEDLQEIQLQTEEMFINSSETVIEIKNKEQENK